MGYKSQEEIEEALRGAKAGKERPELSVETLMASMDSYERGEIERLQDTCKQLRAVVAELAILLVRNGVVRPKETAEAIYNGTIRI